MGTKKDFIIRYSDEIKAALLALRAMNNLRNIDEYSQSEVLEMVKSFEEDIINVRFKNNNSHVIHAMALSEETGIFPKYFGNEILLGTNKWNGKLYPDEVFRPFSVFLDYPEFDLDRIDEIINLFGKLVAANVISFSIQSKNHSISNYCYSSLTPIFDHVKNRDASPKLFVYKTYSDAELEYTHTPLDNNAYEVSFSTEPNWVCSGLIPFDENGNIYQMGGTSVVMSGRGRMYFRTHSLYTVPLGLPAADELYSPKETKSLSLAKKRGKIK